MGRPRTCDCGQCRKCKRREYARERYVPRPPRPPRPLSEEERLRRAEEQRLRNAEYARERYRAMSPEERRAWVGRRDQERVRAADRARAKQPARIAHLIANTRRWREAHPDGARAHRLVAYAIRTGKLVRGPCEHESCDFAGTTHAHHDDYSKPLEVRWLCPVHHAAEWKEP